MKKDFNRLLLAWYDTHARELPWRGHVDAYGVWVSEIMLQQTRVETVIPYFEKWMRTFPTISDLAAASEQQVLNLWEGLGYYSRARSLLKAAKFVHDQLGGQLPQTAAQLLPLPGIGRYTAAAISSIAFGENAAVLDGNVKRVYSRVLEIPDEINTPAGENKMWQVANQMLAPQRAGDFNQALMDLGATICLPKNPDCDHCPISSLCGAFQNNSQAHFPVAKPKQVIPHFIVCAAIIEKDHMVLIAKRPAKGLLGGLWEFPGGKIENGESQQEALIREIQEELNMQIQPLDYFGQFRHAYTHFKVTLHAWKAIMSKDAVPTPLEASEIRWVNIDELSEFPMGKIDRLISNNLRQVNG